MPAPQRMLVWGTLAVGVPEVRRAPLQASAMHGEVDQNPAGGHVVVTGV